jgi:hypothetical protein
MNNSITYTNASGDKPTIKFISKCYNCSHSEVCGYKDEYNKLLEGVEKAFNNQSYNKMFSISVECKYFKDNNFNMINYKDFNINPIPCNPIPCSPTDIGDGGRTILDPNKVTVTSKDFNGKDLSVTLKNNDSSQVCIANTGNKINLESKEGFHNYYTDKDVFS